MFKKRPGFIFAQLLIFLFLVAAITALGSDFSLTVMSDALSMDMARQGGRDIDYALSVWAANNSGEYPEALARLQTAKILPESTSLLPYTYTVSADRLKYQVSVLLQNGTSYITPGSNL